MRAAAGFTVLMVNCSSRVIRPESMLLMMIVWRFVSCFRSILLIDNALLAFKRLPPRNALSTPTIKVVEI